MSDQAQGGGLVLYERARAALAEARNVDEIKDIRDRAVAMQLYAKQARDPELIAHATDIRKRAEIKAGEMLAAMRERGERTKGGRPPLETNSEPQFVFSPTLRNLGVSPTQSHRWQKLAGLSEPEREAAIASAIKEATRSVEMTKAERQAEKRERREEREQAWAGKILALPDKKYGVIFADPEWRFEPWSRKTGMDRAADNHYSTSALEVIKSRNVQSIAAANCALFLCATRPMLPHALEVMEAWGFDYRSCAIWSKDKIGKGYWFRDKNELLLVGIKGEVPAPAMGDQWESEIHGPVREHSEKPDAFFKLIEDYFPNVPKIELNARKRRDGWDAWGFEAPEEGA